MSSSTADQDDQHGRLHCRKLAFRLGHLKKLRCSQHRLDIVLDVLQDEEMRTQKGAQDGSKSALRTAENDDFARDILKKMNNAITSY